MSKPELPVDQSLDEIFATIRKTLGDDRPEDGLSKLDNLPPMAAKDEPEAPAKGNGADTLPNRLADALNGASGEEDLTDLLASDVPSTTLAPKPQSASAGKTRDAPWFLSRGPAVDADVKPATASTQLEASLPEAPREEISLTRPETLRRSFPPLFGGGEATPPRPADIPVDRTKPIEPVPFPTVRPPEAPVLSTPTVADKVPQGALPTKPVPEPPAEPAKTVAPVEAKSRPTAEPIVPVAEKPAFVPEPPFEVPSVAEPPRNSFGPEASTPPRPELAAARFEPPKSDPPRAEPAKPEPVAEAASAQSGQPLQEMIARLLEPVIKQWLDKNLPSMVETAIRAEMDRQFKKPSGELKI
jgi:uncharacterized protein